MAESVVSFVLDNVLLFVEKEARLLSGVKPQCVSLVAQLIWIRAFLRDAEKKRRGDKVVDVWVAELIDFVYDAQDVIDAYELYLERARTHTFIQNVVQFPQKVLLGMKLTALFHLMKVVVESYSLPEKEKLPCMLISHIAISLNWFNCSLRRAGNFSAKGCSTIKFVRRIRVGKEIVGGLPLALVVIAGLLSGKERTPNVWLRVLKDVTWHLSQDSNECRQILILSYLDLPYELKPCFLYIGMYPEDSEIDAQKLMRLWVAEGFIQARGNQETEDVAEDYLEELVQRSLIIVTQRMYCGGPVKSFRIHDLLRDLAVSEGIKDRFLDIHPNNNHSATTSSKSSRRCGIHSNTTGNFLAYLDLKLRSLLVFHGWSELCIDLESIIGGGRIMLLRVLDLEDAMVKGDLPKEIGKLFFLQYLGLRKTLIKSLPTSIGNLNQLQTLDVSHSSIPRFPEGVWSLKKLKHLFLCGLEWDVNRITEEFGSNIRTLEFRIPYQDHFWRPSNFLSKLGRLRSLTIRGAIGFKNDMRIMDWKNCILPSLTEIYFQQLAFQEDPSEILGSLPNLRLLCIHNVGRDPDLSFVSGEFPELQYFYLGYHPLKKWDIRDGGMPNLRHLEINCRLEILPNELKNITTLQKVKLPYFFRNQMDTKGPQWDKFKHVPSISFY